MDGIGIMAWPSGDTYTGNFLDAKNHEPGTYTWASGDVYVGEFYKDMINGEREGRRPGLLVVVGSRAGVSSHMLMAELKTASGRITDLLDRKSKVVDYKKSLYYALCTKINLCNLTL